MHRMPVKPLLWLLVMSACQGTRERPPTPGFKLVAADTVRFNNFVDCNMAEAWVGDTLRIFPGKYGEDPLWGYSHELKFADGRHAEEAFRRPAEAFTEPRMPPNAPPGQPGLHGAVWFETVYQSAQDTSGKTLYGIYHNENYPATLPYDATSGEGYKADPRWPEGLTGPDSPAAVCRIGIMKSTDGGRSWDNRGIFIEDLQARMIMKPHNDSKTFAGGVGDPSAVVAGDYLYLFYGEYGYPGTYSPASFSPTQEYEGQCISIARIAVKDLDNPVGKARRWDGKAFAAAHNAVGKPIRPLQIPVRDGGGPASSARAGFHWGPSVSWNTYLNCWVMLMAKATGPSWQGSGVYISFNTHPDLGKGNNSQDWSKPQLLLDNPGYIMWYPSLQPMNTPEDITEKRTSLRLGQKARLYIKYIKPDKSEYMSAYVVEFQK